ncbi:MAG: four helix bundle protein [Pseudosphingobacterium sp.]|nr:four helix bundle protein [Pseudosphingobacterium sp.]
MRDFKKLIVWQKSHCLAINIYKYTSSFPKEEAFGLISQMRRAALSISSNIAEGSAQESHLQFNRFLIIASGSAAELDCQLLLSKDLGFIDESIYVALQQQITEVRKIIHSFKKKLKPND